MEKNLQLIIFSDIIFKKEFEMKKIILLSSICMLGFAYPNCTMCHNGNVAVDLKKMSYEEIKKDLMMFKKGQMHHSMMEFVKNMTDKEIDEAAKKYSGKNEENSGY